MRVHLNLKFKDLIKIAIIGLFCFLVYSSCDKAEAKSLNFDTNYYDYIDLTSFYSYLKTDSNLLNTYNEFKTWFDSQSVYTYYYYFIDYTGSSNTSFNNDIYLFTSLDDANDFILWVRDRYSNTSGITAYRIETNNPPTSYYEAVIPYNYNFTTSNIYGPFTQPHDNIIQYNTSYPIILFDSNNNFKLGSYNISQTYMLKIDNYYYGNNDILPSVLDNNAPFLHFNSLTPFYDNLQNIYKYEVFLNYTIFDTNTYTYQYLIPDTDSWLDIPSNNYNLELIVNGSYQFRIIENDTNDVVSRTSLTISNITITQPFIINQISTPDSCRIKYNNQELTICKKLYLEPYAYSTNYRFQYSFDNSFWQDLFSSYSFLVQKGDIIYLRVLDNDNNLLWSHTLTFDERLDTIPNDSGIIVSFDDTYEGTDSSKQFFTKIYFYHLDSIYIDSIYISYDGFNWSLLDVSNMGLYLYGRSKYYESNLTFYIKILDSNNDVIFTTSHYVDLSRENNNIVGYLEKFNRNMQGPISSIIQAPLRLVNLLNTGDMCQPLQLPFAHIGNIGFPCLRQVFEQNVPQYLNLYQIITTGLIGYFCSLSMIKTIKTLVRPDDDRIEVVDL